MTQENILDFEKRFNEELKKWKDDPLREDGENRYLAFEKISHEFQKIFNQELERAKKEVADEERKSTENNDSNFTISLSNSTSTSFSHTKIPSFTKTIDPEYRAAGVDSDCGLVENGLDVPKVNLDLSGLGLTNLPLVLFELPLQGLNLRCNRFAILPKEISNLKELEFLRLGSNNLVDIPVEIKELPKLKYFFAQNTLLTGTLALPKLPKTVESYEVGSEYLTREGILANLDKVEFLCAIIKNNLIEECKLPLAEELLPEKGSIIEVIKKSLSNLYAKFKEGEKPLNAIEKEFLKDASEFCLREKVPASILFDNEFNSTSLFAFSANMLEAYSLQRGLIPFVPASENEKKKQTIKAEFEKEFLQGDPKIFQKLCQGIGIDNFVDFAEKFKASSFEKLEEQDKEYLKTQTPLTAEGLVNSMQYEEVLKNKPEMNRVSGIEETQSPSPTARKPNAKRLGILVAENSSTLVLEDIIGKSR